MNSQTQAPLWQIILRGVSALVFAATGVIFMSNSTYADHVECRFIDENGQEVVIPCPHFIPLGGNPPSIIKPVPPEATALAEHLLPRTEQWRITPQELFPARTLSQGDTVTVMLAREYPGEDGAFVQPLVVNSESNIPIMYEIIIGENNAAAEYDLGVLQKDAVGGTYIVLAIPQQVDSPEAFWEALESVTPDMVGVQRFAVENRASLEVASALLNAYGRQIDIPVTLDPNLDAEADVELQWRKDGQPLPQADNPLQPGIYDTTLQTQDQAIIGVYAPLEFVIENFAPALSPQLGPYFTPGEYEIDVLVDGVLESTETLVIP